MSSTKSLANVCSTVFASEEPVVQKKICTNVCAQLNLVRRSSLGETTNRSTIDVATNSKAIERHKKLAESWISAKKKKPPVETCRYPDKAGTEATCTLPMVNSDSYEMYC